MSQQYSPVISKFTISKGVAVTISSTLLPASLCTPLPTSHAPSSGNATHLCTQLLLITSHAGTSAAAALHSWPDCSSPFDARLSSTAMCLLVSNNNPDSGPDCTAAWSEMHAQVSGGA